MIHVGRVLMLSLAIGITVSTVQAEPLGTTFSYQGQIKQAGVPVNDICDIQMTLWDDPALSFVENQVGPTLSFDGSSAPPVNITNGLFQVDLDFGADAFTGDARWLEIDICCSSPCAPAYTTLNPRQPLTATPNSLHTRGINVDDAGNVGIGIMTPLAKLHVDGVALFDGIKFSDGTIQSTAAPDTGSAVYWDGTGDDIYNINAGKVGIGTNAPQSALHVMTFNPDAIYGESIHQDGIGVTGYHNLNIGTAPGVFGQTDSVDNFSSGVKGLADAPEGKTYGGHFLSKSPDGIGVIGFHADNAGINPGVHGQTESTADSAAAIVGFAAGMTGKTFGGKFESISPDGMGVSGLHSNGAGTNPGVFGQTNSTANFAVGVFGLASKETGMSFGGSFQSKSPDGTGARGLASALTGATAGGDFQSNSPDGIGVYGLHFANSGVKAGVSGETNSIEDSASGVYGVASRESGQTAGGHFRSDSPDGIGVFGEHFANTGDGPGVFGQTMSPTNNATGVFGGAYAESGLTFGGEFVNESPGGAGAVGWHRARTGKGPGIFGQTDSNTDQAAGVFGWATRGSGLIFGVNGQCDSPLGIGVHGHSEGIGVLGEGDSVGVYGTTAVEDFGTAVWSDGDCFIDGDLTVNFGDARISQDLSVDGNIVAAGTITGSAKMFKIDHPLDPANKYLNHYCIEGPEPLLIYRGNATLNNNGEAWVELPNYFEEINRDFQYQLTCIGSFSPVYVAQKVQGNRFKIAGGQSGSEISWTVTGVRNDPYMRKHGTPVVEDKSEKDRGKYVQPELYGKPKEMGVYYIRPPVPPTAIVQKMSKAKTSYPRKMIETRRIQRSSRRSGVDAISRIPNARILEPRIQEEGGQ